jgi:uncharacterized protein YbdZ (MbtH family)
VSINPFRDADRSFVVVVNDDRHTLSPAFADRPADR